MRKNGTETSTRKCHLHKTQKFLRLIVWHALMLYFPFGHCSDWCFVFPLFFALCRVYLHLFRTKCVLLEQAVLCLAHFHYNVQYMFFVSTIFRCKCLSIPHFSWSVCETCVFFPNILQLTDYSLIISLSITYIVPRFSLFNS